MRKFSPWIAGNALLALGYLITGKLGLMLAIPPGYASAIFPAAGIALAAVILWRFRLLPGICLGSFALNIWISNSATGTIDSTSVLTAAGIALGATLQALFGTLLVQRFSQSPTALATDRDILVLLLLGGAVACITSATCGVTTLYLAQTIHADLFLFSWWNWWVGDTLGVLILTPMMFILFATPRKSWQKRATSVAIPLVLASGIVIFMFVLFSRYDASRLQSQFQERSKLMSEAIRFHFELYINRLSALERLFVSSQQVERDEFKLFVSPMLDNYPGIQALEWLPRVTKQQRQPFQQRIRGEGFRDFEITERDSHGNLVPADQRAQYFPVTFVEPLAGNEKAFGYDVSSDKVRRTALQYAQQHATATMTEKILLVQDEKQQAGALIFYPVFRLADKHGAENQRGDKLMGFVLGVFIFGKLIDSALASFPAELYQLQVRDISGDTPGPLWRQAPMQTGQFDERVFASEVVEIANRKMLFEFYPTETYFRTNRSWQTWLVLACGLLFAGLLGAFLLSITGRGQRIQHLVDQRTLELSAILDNAVEAIITFKHTGHIETANPAAQRLFGYAETEIVGKSIDKFVPDTLQRLGANPMQGTSMEMQGIRHDHSAFPVEFGISEVRLPVQRLYTGIIHDLTERHKIDRLKNEFISTVSHELRTPVTSIRGALGLMHERLAGNLDDEAKHMLEIAFNNSQRLVNLVNDILNIEKLEFGSITFNYDNHDIVKLIEESVALNDAFAAQYHVRLEFAPKAPISPGLKVFTDKDRFFQIMSNLVSNAVKFSKAGDNVEIQLAPDHGMVQISVVDHGPGIPQSFQDRMFHKFAQADASDSRQRGGTGLGLSIVQTIVAKMSGELGYNTHPGKGTTFYFSLPMAH